MEPASATIAAPRHVRVTMDAPEVTVGRVQVEVGGQTAVSRTPSSKPGCRGCTGHHHHRQAAAAPAAGRGGAQVAAGGTAQGEHGRGSAGVADTRAWDPRSESHAAHSRAALRPQSADAAAQRSTSHRSVHRAVPQPPKVPLPDKVVPSAAHAHSSIPEQRAARYVQHAGVDRFEPTSPATGHTSPAPRALRPKLASRPPPQWGTSGRVSVPPQRVQPVHYAYSSGAKKPAVPRPLPERIGRPPVRPPTPADGDAFHQSSPELEPSPRDPRPFSHHVDAAHGIYNRATPKSSGAGAAAGDDSPSPTPRTKKPSSTPYAVATDMAATEVMPAATTTEFGTRVISHRELSARIQRHRHDISPVPKESSPALVGVASRSSIRASASGSSARVYSA